MEEVEITCPELDKNGFPIITNGSFKVDVRNKQTGQPIKGLTVDDFYIGNPNIELKQIDETTFKLDNLLKLTTWNQTQ